MAKIRTIKVEFWTSEQVVNCSINARLLFIGMWNFCDDDGNHPASCSRLKMEIFPADPFSFCDIQNWVDELLRVDLLIEYEYESKLYWHVTGWDHQTIARPFYKFPKPTDPKAVLRQCSSSAQAVLGQCSGTAVNGNGNGNGNGNLYILSSSAENDQPVDNSGAAQLDPTESSKKKTGKDREYRETAKRLIEFFNEKVGRRARMTDTNIKIIVKQLKTGATEAECRQVIVRRNSVWPPGHEMHPYVRIETLFGKKFESYIAELVLPKEDK